MRYYRGKFMIGVYSLLSEGETLLALCDNVHEFASLLQTDYFSAANILTHLFKGKSKYIKFGKKLRTVEFIKMED